MLQLIPVLLPPPEQVRPGGGAGSELFASLQSWNACTFAAHFLAACFATLEQCPALPVKMGT
jgi:hypothetical protein